MSTLRPEISPHSTRDTVRSILLDNCARQPDRVYVRCHFPGGHRTDVSYRTLIDRGSQFANALREAGVGTGEIVIVILPHSAELYCAFFGAILDGLIPAILAVPSFKLSPEHYIHELQALLDRIGARAVITDSDTAQQLGMGTRRLQRSNLILAEEAQRRSPLLRPVDVEPNDIVLLQHSSGSTGLKKGVALSNRAVIAQVRAYAESLQLRADDRIASWLPLYHDMGLIACAMMPAILEVPVSALSPLHWVTSPASLFRVIAEDECTLAWMPNFAYEFCAARIRLSQLQDARLDSMRGWINCSEPTIAESHRGFLERFQPLGVRPSTLWTCYAAAETTFAVSQSTDRVPPRVESVLRDPFLGRGEAVPAPNGSAGTLEMMSGGVLLAGTEARIVGADGNDLPDRRVGEIAIRSDSLFSGYFRDPESTAAILRDGWYYSGDLGYRADDHLFITGRKKDLIIIAGANYYPQDIERIVSAVAGIHPGRVVALGMDDPTLGTQRLIVLAEVDEPASIDSPELSAAVRTAVSEQLDCVIDDLRLVPHMWLLKTSSGKIARAPNLERYSQELAPVASRPFRLS